MGYAKVDPEVAAIVADAVKVFEEQGATVEEIDPGFDDPMDIFNKHWFRGATRLIDNQPQVRPFEMPDAPRSGIFNGT